MSKVLLVSPPYMKLSTPSYEMPIALTKGCDYMNPGLLICSSCLDEAGIDNEIVKISNPLDEAEIEKHISNDTVLVGISCTCAWEYLESLKIAEIIKKKHNDIKILISGWQIKSIKELTFADSEYIDYLIVGDAEYTIKELYNSIVNNEDTDIISVIKRDATEVMTNQKRYPEINFRVLDFSKFPNYLNYMPYVEESRNCPYSCQFCLNSCVMDRYQNVPFDIFKNNVEMVEKLYGPNANANLLAANFGVNSVETRKKLDYLKTKKLNWNIELHVDNHWEDYIEDLESAGINKVSIGFESGSPTILKLMNKSQNPDKYLSRLELMLQKLNEQNIKPSLNLLIDYRENYDTLKDTLEFLNKNKTYIKKVKANFMFAFEGLIKNIDMSYNPNIIIDDYGKKIHAFPILPNNVTLEDMAKIVYEIERGNYSVDILSGTGFVREEKVKIR